MKSLIYGYGITGKSFERYLQKKNLEFDIFDSNISKFKNIEPLEEYDYIYCSPGVPRSVFKLLKSKSNILTDLDIFFREDTSIKIGITGTNRKSTTCFHLYQLFKSQNIVNLIGNIGNPMLDSINNGKKYSIIELSSFQLDKMSVNELDFGILLNIAEDHLDYHGSFEDYKRTKKKVLNSKKFLKTEDPYEIFEWITGSKAQNQTFKDLPYRYQKISNSIINDSKSTNMHSLQYAIELANKGFQNKNYVLITCGNPEKERFSKVSLDGPEEVLICGNHRKEISECIQNTNKKIFLNLRKALDHIKQQKNIKNILFSPGYPSGSDYRNFEERGKNFNLLVEEIFNE